MVNRYTTEILTVEASDFRSLVEIVRELSADGGWVNIAPSVDDENRVEVPGIFSWFSARGPQVPVGTFVAGTDRLPASVGVEHGFGRGASARLVEARVPVPESWVRRQDHPKRGLVWEVNPHEVEAKSVVDLLLKATETLCPLSFDGRWTAEISRLV